MSGTTLLDQLVERIKTIPGVAALAAYGSTGTTEWTAHSDIDLIVWIDQPTDINSVHFTVQGIPVDLNVKSIQAWQSGNYGWLPPSPLLPLWDPGKVIGTASTPSPSGSRAEAYQYRYAHAHRLLKLQKVIGTDDEVADFLAAGATHWIAVSYCHARGQRFPGIDKLVSQWRVDDPQMVTWLAESVRSRHHRLENIRSASERALEPIGGLLAADEMYVTGTDGPADDHLYNQASDLIAPLLIDAPNVCPS